MQILFKNTIEYAQKYTGSCIQNSTSIQLRGVQDFPLLQIPVKLYECM